MYQHQRVPLPVEQLGGVPQPLIVLLEVLLEKDPARRFQSPAELLKVMPMVRDAIEAGSFLMKTIRVFVSSTGDVQKERILADRVIRSVAAEFNVPVRVPPFQISNAWQKKMVSRKLNPRITRRWSFVPIFWNIRGSNRKRDAGDRSRTRRNLIW